MASTEKPTTNAECGDRSVREGREDGESDGGGSNATLVDDFGRFDRVTVGGGTFECLHPTTRKLVAELTLRDCTFTIDVGRVASNGSYTRSIEKYFIFIEHPDDGGVILADEIIATSPYKTVSDALFNENRKVRANARAKLLAFPYRLDKERNNNNPLLLARIDNVKRVHPFQLTLECPTGAVIRITGTH